MVDPPLNFVPKNPIESALAETLAEISAPAWIIDVDRGVVAGSNGRGVAVWGVPALAPALDGVVPALRVLRSRFAQGSFLETTTSTVEPLKFWTTGGVRTLACEVRTLDESVGPSLLLLIAGAEMKSAAERTELRRGAVPVAARALRSDAPPARAEPARERKLDDAGERKLEAPRERKSNERREPKVEAPRERRAEPPRERSSAIERPAPAVRPEKRAASLSRMETPAIPPDPAPKLAASPAPNAPLNDMETLREIARRIRQGSARMAAASVDAPANQDYAGTAPAPTEPQREQTSEERFAHLAHEIRTPLAAIVSLAEVITEERLGAWPNERYRSYVRDILESARHGLDVVDAILRDAPGRVGLPRTFSDIDLNAEVDAIGTSLQPLAEKSGARIAPALVGGLPAIRADRRNVRQMLLNLVTNSIKHGGPSVRIKITTGYELSGDVWVEVEDNGPGLPPAETGTPPRKAGLGLPLTRSLAEANGARLDLKSEPGRGVRARLVFGGDQAAR